MLSGGKVYAALLHLPLGSILRLQSAIERENEGGRAYGPCLYIMFRKFSSSLNQNIRMPRI